MIATAAVAINNLLLMDLPLVMWIRPARRAGCASMVLQRLRARAVPDGTETERDG
jgi:hypothetical protein